MDMIQPPLALDIYLPYTLFPLLHISVFPSKIGKVGFHLRFQTGFQTGFQLVVLWGLDQEYHFQFESLSSPLTFGACRCGPAFRLEFGQPPDPHCHLEGQDISHSYKSHIYIVGNLYK